MARKKSGGPGVPSDWCIQIKYPQSELAEGSFRNQYFALPRKGTSADKADYGITYGCLKGHWTEKGVFKGEKQGKCEKGGLVLHRFMAPKNGRYFTADCNRKPKKHK